MPPRKKAYPYQKRGIWKIHAFKGRALLADDMGLGKTFQALQYAKVFLDSGPVVVVCPASVKWNWQREAEQVGFLTHVLERRRPPTMTGNLLRHQSNTVYVVNYDILGDGAEGSRHPTWNHFLKALRPKLVLLDECHYLKSRGAKRTRWVRQLVQDVGQVVGMSGTPMTSRPAELWSVLNILRPDEFPEFGKFARRYCAQEWTPWGMKYGGAKRLPELHRRLKGELMVRRRKADVLDELPAKTRVVVPVDLPDMRQYLEAERDLVRWLRKTHPDKRKGFRNSQRMVRFGYLKRLIGELKLPAVKQWVEDFLGGSDGKLIAFAVHKKVVGPLVETFKRCAVKVDGSVTGRARQATFDRFTANDAVRLLVGNVQAAGVGWNGQVANSVVFAEFGLTPGEHTQAEDRAHRMGQKKPVTIYYLVARGTIEEDLVRKVQRKQQVLDEALDGDKAVDGFDILDDLEAKLLKRGGRRGRKKP
jgi:SWI/SNF-related matrix-associated actin-dependent regulator 1 of chromatin subfamily A